MTRPSEFDGGGGPSALRAWGRASVQYGVGLGAVGLATVCRWALDPWLGASMPFMLYVPVLVVLAWYCRVGPLLAAAAAGYLAADYLFIEPRGSLLAALPAGGLWEVSYLLAVGSAVFVAGRSRAAGRRAASDAAAAREMAAALLESEGRLRALHDATFDAVCVHEDGVALEVNAAFEVMLGYGRDEVVGRPVLERVFAPGSLEGARERIGSGDESPHEAVMVRKDGASLTAEVRTRAAELGGRRVRVTSIRDITAKRRAMEALAESEARYRASFERAAVGAARVDPATGRFLEVNRRLCEMTGYEPYELLGMSYVQLSHPEDVQKGRESLDRLVRGLSREHRVEKRYIRKDGGIAHVQISAGAVRDGNGRVRYLVTAVADVTERARAEEALRESEARYSGIFRQAAVGIIQGTADGRYSAVNGAFCEMLGYTAEELMSRPAVEFTHPEDRAASAGRVERVMRGEVDGFSHEKRFVRKDGGVVWADTRVSVVRDAGGRVLYSVGVVQDITERKRAEEALRRSDERYRTVVEGQSEMVCRFRTDGTVLFVNGAYARARGADPESLVGANFWGFVEEGDRAGVRALLDGLRPEAPEVRIENRFETSEGVRWTLWTNRGLAFDEDGRATEVQSSGIDITDRKRAEGALRESEERYRTLFNSIDEGFCVAEVLFDRDGKAVDYRFLEVNPAFEKQTGLRGAAGKRMRELAPNHEAHWFETYGRVAVTGEPVRFVNEAKALDGRWFDVYAFRLGGPESRRVAILFSDITQRVRAERAQGHLAALVASSQDAIISKDLDGRILSWNPAASRLFGYTAEEAVGRPITMLIPPERLGEETMILAKVRKGERVEHYETIRVAKDGRPLGISLTISPIRDAAGRIVAASKIARDITSTRDAERELARYRERLEELVEARTVELEKTHQQLRMGERMASLGTLSLGLGHDMGNLLLPIRARLDVLDARKDLPGDIRESLDPIRTCTEYLQNLSRGLRLFALDPEDEDAAANTTELGVWAHEALPFLKNAVGRKISFEHDVPGDLPAPAVAPHRLTQAVLNLVTNARDAIGRDRPGVVGLRARRSADGSEVAISVTDDGPGMTPEVRVRCLEPFYTTKTRAVSTGLGLALVRGIVERSGGRMHIDSAPGEGTTVTLVLPAAVEAADDEGGSVAVAAVTVADARIGSMLSGLLRVMGFEVRASGDSPDAEAELWVVEPTAERLAAAQRFVRSGAGRGVLAVGEAGAEWDGPRIVSVSAQAGFGAIRSAVVRALDDDREPSVGPSAARAG